MLAINSEIEDNIGSDYAIAIESRAVLPTEQSAYTNRQICPFYCRPLAYPVPSRSFSASLSNLATQLFCSSIPPP